MTRHGSRSGLLLGRGRRRRSLLTRWGTAVLTAATLAACATTPAAAPAPAATEPSSIVVGSANFAENEILAEIYVQALAAKGVDVEKRLNIGNRETYYPDLQNGSVDLVPEYTGALLRYLKGDTGQNSADDVYRALRGALPDTLTVLDKSTAEDKDSVVVTRQTATRLQVGSIADLAPHCADLVFGGSPEFQNRTEGIPGLVAAYGCSFKQYRVLDASGPLSRAALTSGDVQAADLFTTDASIPANGFVVLADPKGVFAAQNVVPLMNKAKATETVVQTLDAVSAKLTTENLTKLNTEAASDAKPSPETVARNWLSDNGLA